MRPSVLIAVTHLLGVGHFARSVALGRELAKIEHAVTVVSGGMPAPLIDVAGLDFVQLPPIRTADESFSALRDGDGRPVDPAYLERRRHRLAEIYRRRRPDILVTELYPFGRRALAAEFDALLNLAEAESLKPLVVCSVRDILVAPAGAERLDRAHAILRDRYDAVLVHGDPEFVPLGASWPLPDDLAGKLHHTGYVDAGAVAAASDAHPTESGADILVSGGASTAAVPLYRAALQAAAARPERAFRLLVGRAVPEAEYRALADAAPSNATVERARADFRALLRQARLFVGLGGYNTVVDVLATGTRSVLVPFERGSETEQRVRADRMARAGRAVVLPEVRLDAAALLDAVDRAERLPPPSPPPDLTGAAGSVRVLDRLWRGREDSAHRGGLTRPSLRRAALPPALARAISEDLTHLLGRGIRLRLWWRDDDATAPSAELDRLLRLTARFDAPVAVAAIPALASAALAARLADAPGTRVLVHGWTHANHQAPGTKASEFGSVRFEAERRRDAGLALEQARDLFGSRLLPVFVPPWNRMEPSFRDALPLLGFRGVSCFGNAPRREAGFVRIDTHLDPVAWRAGRDLLGEAALLAQWNRALRPILSGDAEPTVGMLSHHRATSDRVWAFLDDLVQLLLESDAADFLPLAKLWSAGPYRENGEPEPHSAVMEDIAG